MGSQQYGIDPNRLKAYAQEIKGIVEKGFKWPLLLVEGNIFRVSPVWAAVWTVFKGDYMGMLATVINGLALQSALENEGIHTRLQTAIKMNKVAEPLSEGEP